MPFSNHTRGGGFGVRVGGAQGGARGQYLWRDVAGAGHAECGVLHLNGVTHGALEQIETRGTYSKSSPSSDCIWTQETITGQGTNKVYCCGDLGDLVSLDGWTAYYSTNNGKSWTPDGTGNRTYHFSQTPVTPMNFAEIAWDGYPGDIPNGACLTFNGSTDDYESGSGNPGSAVVDAHNVTYIWAASSHAIPNIDSGLICPK
jgi:hypothetical protein